jgi:pimeloyl-ACP methyl ester carboxylesterase
MKRPLRFVLVAALAALAGGCAHDIRAVPTDPWKAALGNVAAGAAATQSRDSITPGVISAESKTVLISAGWDGTDATLTVAIQHLAFGATLRADPKRARAVVEACLVLAKRAEREHADPRGLYLCALRVAHDEVESNAANRATFASVENFVISRLGAELGRRIEEAARAPIRVRGPVEDYDVHIVRGAGDGGVAPSTFESMEACDSVRVLDASAVVKVSGVGTPLLGRVNGYELNRNRPGFRPLEGFLWPVTATVDFSPEAKGVRRATFSLFDPRLAEQVSYLGQRATLASDYTTPIAVTATEQRKRKLGLGGLLHGGAYLGSTGLYPTQPYTEKKIPVVLVHGLLSDQDTWAYLLNEIAADPELRKRYQYWVYYYPTGLPVPYSAFLMRDQIAKIRAQEHPGGSHSPLRRVIVVGHSMGGLLARFMVSNSGDALYNAYFIKPIGQLNLTPERRERLRRAMYFKAEPGIQSVVFIATPHRGSGLADNPLAYLVRQFVKQPPSVKEEISATFVANRESMVHPIGVRGSLDSLSPENEIYVALPKMKIPTQIRLHSIIGNRGDGRTVGSSDGVVPYSSSHLDGVASEVMVPAGHSGTLKRPETAKELRRILKENSQGLIYLNRKRDTKSISSSRKSRP